MNILDNLKVAEGDILWRGWTGIEMAGWSG
jgi:hypothetical protein